MASQQLAGHQKASISYIILFCVVIRRVAGLTSVNLPTTPLLGLWGRFNVDTNRDIFRHNSPRFLSWPSLSTPTHDYAGYSFSFTYLNVLVSFCNLLILPFQSIRRLSRL